ncbi:hypothetical protein K0U83_17695, partial [bacterium]|nr:hypothetical protein [bacterium]
ILRELLSSVSDATLSEFGKIGQSMSEQKICWSCQKLITESDAVVLSMDTAPVPVCRTCWTHLKPAERLAFACQLSDLRIQVASRRHLRKLVPGQN